MDNNHYKKYEPVFGSWKIGKALGAGSFGKVFEIEHEEFGKKYKAALKIISIPQSQSEVKSLMSEGLSREEAIVYYELLVKSIISECDLMSELKGNSFIVSYEDHKCYKHEDEIGFDIMIRMELLTPLLDYLNNNSISEREVLKIGIDICRALEVCNQKKIIHRDVKPENIFVSSTGNFKLGDFGIARTLEKTSGGLSKKGTYSYMAPEVYLGGEYGPSVDVYSLGIVLYRLLNNNRAPFLPPYPERITHNIKEEALARRFSGESIPAIPGIDSVLSDIVLKACQYRQEDRYSTPIQFRRELTEYARSKAYNELLDSDDFDIEEGGDNDATVLIEQEKTATEQNKYPAKRKFSKYVLSAIITAFSFICVVGIGFAMSHTNDADDKTLNVASEAAGKAVAETPKGKYSVAGDAEALLQTIRNASSGDTIYIEEGQYSFDEPITINTDNVSIVGKGETKPVLNCGFYITGFDVTLENLDLEVDSPSCATEGSDIIKIEGGGVTNIKNVDVNATFASERIIYGMLIYSDANINESNIDVSNAGTNGNVALWANAKLNLKGNTIKSNDLAVSYLGSDLSDTEVEEWIKNNEIVAPTRVEVPRTF